VVAYLSARIWTCAIDCRGKRAVFGAAAASTALVNEAQQVLEFKVAYGKGKGNVVGLSVPLDHGIAGYVVMTGQPISVHDVHQDVRFNKDFASSTGYVPQAILATPLIVDDQVIGVMEVLDKINAPSFGMQDMDLLGVFARQAAIAIRISQQNDRLNEAIVGGLRRLVNEKDSPELARALDKAGEMGLEEDLLAIADQFNAISQLGDAELHLCLETLKIFGNYARQKIALY
jgi:GAF domain-containing protein